MGLAAGPGTMAGWHAHVQLRTRLMQLYLPEV